MHGEQHRIAHLLPHPIVVAVADEQAAQPLLADVGLDGQRKTAFARGSERARIEIGAEHLDRLAARFVAGRLIQQQNGERVCLFAGCTARDPYPHRLVGGFVLE